MPRCPLTATEPRPSARGQTGRLKHLFFASTDAAYYKYVPGGMPHPIREDTMPLTPVGWYPLSKQVGEDMCLGYHRTYNLPVTVFRFSMTVAGDEILNYRQFYLGHWLRTYESKTGQAGVALSGKATDQDGGRFHLVRGNTTWIGSEGAPIVYDEYDKICSDDIFPGHGRINHMRNPREFRAGSKRRQIYAAAG